MYYGIIGLLLVAFIAWAVFRYFAKPTMTDQAMHIVYIITTKSALLAESGEYTIINSELGKEAATQLHNRTSGGVLFKARYYPKEKMLKWKKNNI